jgi:hypothetical protein
MRLFGLTSAVASGLVLLVLGVLGLTGMDGRLRAAAAPRQEQVIDVSVEHRRGQCPGREERRRLLYEREL